MTTVGEIVARLIAAGTPPDVAAMAVAEAFSAGVASIDVRRQSADITAERRREKDRDRKRQIRRNPQMSDDIPQTQKTALTVLPSSTSNFEKEKKVRARKHPLSADFQPNEKHFEAAAKLGIPRQAVFEKCEDMRIWAQSSGAVKADWDATLHGFLRRDASKLQQNGAGNGNSQRKSGSVVEAARRFAEQFESEQRGDIPSNPGSVLRISS